MPIPLFGDENVLKNKTKKEVLAEKILEMIFTGLLRDGDVLPSERELANTFSVSRETVRGSLGVISEFGLLNISHGAKTTINRSPELLQTCQSLLPSLSDLEVNNYNIDTVFETRKIIERAVVRKATLNIDASGIKALRVLLEQQEKLFDQPVHFQLSDKQFHRIIAECVPNEILNNYVQELYSYGLQFRRVVLSVEGSIEKSYHEHMMIFRALENRDPDRAEEMMINHLNSVYDTTLIAMKNRNGFG
ncbi:GntR family transcriptional regulator [Enterovibrio norvegicus]|uniref:DNA-binding transcriptional regulator, FadR family n=2 Tax=Enterovibrio norvegicus TaxID=188144 RepID=A0A1I5LBL7_9GAMM|nr:FCD domain-containing protein [Enterovibrio norvegicus]MCC4797067.1 FCD domain-containing protein [Enterovibrio norvegicus]OEE60191.1 GntR family transcriptional regulator [Enterovibrio norvegicus]OEF58125.1 GntR family transcriptional regulator [Enterovibrio norvegicus]OEF62588.1 GntR family transcriptional regulator [Enterovibrio norvegicus]PMH63483.1 GntR family transcriptional regulator [Enterovibrio norvegicus]